MSRDAPVDVDVHPLVARRWSPRSFTDAPVSSDALQRMLEAARWAPSCFNEQPWRFLVADRSGDPEGHTRLGALLNEGNAWARAAPVLVLGATLERFARNDRLNAHARYDLGQAVAWLTVQATHEELFLHQLAGFSREAAFRELGLPDGVDPVVMLAIGHLGPASALPPALEARETAPRRRQPRQAITLGARWGQPLT